MPKPEENIYTPCPIDVGAYADTFLDQLPEKLEQGFKDGKNNGLLKAYVNEALGQRGFLSRQFDDLPTSDTGAQSAMQRVVADNNTDAVVALFKGLHHRNLGKFSNVGAVKAALDEHLHSNPQVIVITQKNGEKHHYHTDNPALYLPEDAKGKSLQSLTADLKEKWEKFLETQYPEATVKPDEGKIQLTTVPELLKQANCNVGDLRRPFCAYLIQVATPRDGTPPTQLDLIMGDLMGTVLGPNATLVFEAYEHPQGLSSRKIYAALLTMLLDDSEAHQSSKLQNRFRSHMFRFENVAQTGQVQAAKRLAGYLIWDKFYRAIKTADPSNKQLETNVQTILDCKNSELLENQIKTLELRLSLRHAAIDDSIMQVLTAFSPRFAQDRKMRQERLENPNIQITALEYGITRLPLLRIIQELCHGEQVLANALSLAIPMSLGCATSAGMIWLPILSTPTPISLAIWVGVGIALIGIWLVAALRPVSERNFLGSQPLSPEKAQACQTLYRYHRAAHRGAYFFYDPSHLTLARQIRAGQVALDVAADASKDTVTREAPNGPAAGPTRELPTGLTDKATVGPDGDGEPGSRDSSLSDRPPQDPATATATPA